MANPVYINLLADQLGLGNDDLKREAKLVRLCEDLCQKILTPIDGAITWHWKEGDIAGPDEPPADWTNWPVLTDRSVWGRDQAHTWFVSKLEIPENARGKTLLVQISSGWQARQGSTDPQCLAWLDGQISQAVDGNHTEIMIARDANPGETHFLHLNAFTFFDRPLVGFGARYVTRDERAEALYHDIQTPLDVAIRLHQSDPRRHAMLDLIERALHALDRRAGREEAFQASLPAAEEIAAQIYAIPDTGVKPQVTAIGHTHLDVGWLWRVCHTRDKTGRSFATVLNLLAEHPDFVFMYNQAVLLDFLKRDYPEIWDRVKERVAAGQFEIEGAMWVEPDVNIVSGESLIRQIMRGCKFHNEEFGVTPKSVWLPDTFGYSANLPQILRGTGMEYFVTSKLSWNDTNRHPYDSFFWRGIDGSEVKAQLITTQRLEEPGHRTVYNSDLSVSEVMGAWNRYEPKAAHNEIVIPFGHGDGGGGPTRDMIARGRRLASGIPGAPLVKMEPLREFLDRLGKKMDAPDGNFPTWVGELYLQYHRGTLTSVAANKAMNRRAEEAMRGVEFAATMAQVLSGHPYPAEVIERLWEVVLLNQFHDILPGTSIAQVYSDSDADYAALFGEIDSDNGPLLLALKAIWGPKAGLTILNITGQARDGELVSFGEHTELAGKSLVSDGHVSAFQEIHRPEGRTEQVVRAYGVPSLGWTPAHITESGDQPQTTLSAGTHHLENAHLRIELDDTGELASVYDKTLNRQLLPEGSKANRLVAYEDKPWTYDAWDIEAYFEDQSWPLSDCPTSIDCVETGPHRAAIRISRKYGQSEVVQIISLEADARQIEFDTWLDWRERQTVLKAEFSCDLNASDIRSEIQFGHIKRPTHRNTDWDRARFEASQHRWLDLSEADFGMALLNDCKYGYDAHDQTVRLTLVRGSVDPWADADVGEHRFRYALMLHNGEMDLELVHRAAERFNMPLKLLGSPANVSQGNSFSFAQSICQGITMETVKMAEDGSGVILRIYEHGNRRQNVDIKFGLPVTAAERVDLMERPLGQSLELSDNRIQIELKPFEIATIKLLPGKGAVRRIRTSLNLPPWAGTYAEQS
jgi:alpha-mannosidase